MKPVRYLHSITPTTIPLFLAPAFAESSVTTPSAIRSFSSTTCNRARKGRDLNKRRGESVIRSTGPRRRLNVQYVFRELPKPRAEEDRPLKEFPMNPNHGLYGFFNKDKETVVPGQREEQHGRPWEYRELVFKSFSDLHAIYWQGLLEINRVRTRMLEHRRLKLGFGQLELQERLFTVKDTLINIRSVLKHRQEAWEEAKLIKEQTRTMASLDEYLNDMEAERGFPRIDIVRDPDSSRLTSVPEDLPSLGRASSVPEDLPIPDRNSPVSEDLPSSGTPQGQPVLPPRPN